MLVECNQVSRKWGNKMDTVILVSGLIGVCLAFTGWVWGFLVATRISSVWCIAILIGAIVALPLLALTHWDKAKKPFIVWGIGTVLFLGAIVWIYAYGK
jgi:hypothetical protein